MDKYVRVEDVMSFINTSNRGNSDYFIVDQIEDLCKNKAKTLEEFKKEQDTKECSKKVVAKYSFEHNDGDQIWEDRTTYCQLNDGTFQKEYYDGYYDETRISPITYNEIVKKMCYVEKEAKLKQEAIEMYGSHHPLSRGGYIIDVPLQKEENRLNEEQIDEEQER